MGKAANEQYEGSVAWMTANGAVDVIRLFKNDFTPDADSVVGDFTQADFSGYSEVNPADVFFPNSTDHRWEYQHGVVLYQHNGGATANTIYGWYALGGVHQSIADGGSHSLSSMSDVMYCERFASPITMSQLADSIRLHLHAHLFGVDD